MFILYLSEITKLLILNKTNSLLFIVLNIWASSEFFIIYLMPSMQVEYTLYV